MRVPPFEGALDNEAYEDEGFIEEEQEGALEMVFRGGFEMHNEA